MYDRLDADGGWFANAVVRGGLELALLSSVILPALARADEVLPDAVAPHGITVAEVALLTAPLLLYSAFSIFRSQVNPKAKISDFLFILVALIIVANIISIIFFKTRIFWSLWEPELKGSSKAVALCCQSSADGTDSDGPVTPFMVLPSTSVIWQEIALAPFTIPGEHRVATSSKLACTGALDADGPPGHGSGKLLQLHQRPHPHGRSGSSTDMRTDSMRCVHSLHNWKSVDTYPLLIMLCVPGLPGIGGAHQGMVVTGASSICARFCWPRVLSGFVQPRTFLSCGWPTMQRAKRITSTVQQSRHAMLCYLFERSWLPGDGMNIVMNQF
jgi:hypothetical protein